ncbi:hypothetical protein CIB95_06665 [Lottiidibacillus patelloidae]|uniref:DUF309 domain-containing protein n=1 Tax=Lottiidibacillus patelloidae TaxID=2670334 RepID=A0A263BUZ0_9BACI|nr:DUF309 domain-containing protein [Lottiidibacillus patelloidae]OZM57147.1 hypothetical protein CIB95_06665 [Lottiidibacillus patelloidae]
MYPKEYIQYLVYFHSLRDYFECHEVLEEYWKSEPKDKRKEYWVGLIQLAVGLYHHRRKNFAGALRMLTSAQKIIDAKKDDVEKLGLDVATLLQLLDKRIKEVESGRGYTSFNLPIADKDLLSHCQSLSLEWNSIWGTKSDLSNEFLLHKHKKRDRKEVIETRKAQLEHRKKNRS